MTAQPIQVECRIFGDVSVEQAHALQTELQLLAEKLGLGVEQLLPRPPVGPLNTHTHTSQTPYRFEWVQGVGYSPTVLEGVLADFGFTDEWLAGASADDVEEAVAQEHRGWLLEQVDDNAGWQLGPR